jgi:hypothetical protein
MTQDGEFRIWLSEVDGIVRRECEGLGILNFPDWHWRDRFEGGDGPASAAYDFIDEEVYP